MRAYSIDLRTKVVAAVDRGMATGAVARAFGVSLSTVKRYRQQRRQTGSIAPRPIPGRPAVMRRDHDAVLRAQLEAQPDAILEEHCQRWEEQQGMHVSIATMARAIRRLGWTRKKRQ